MAYTPASGYYGNSGLFSPVPVGMTVRPRKDRPGVPTNRPMDSSFAATSLFAPGRPEIYGGTDPSRPYSFSPIDLYWSENYPWSEADARQREIQDAYYGGGVFGPTFTPRSDQTAPDYTGAQDRYDAIAREARGVENITDALDRQRDLDESYFFDPGGPTPEAYEDAKQAEFENLYEAEQRFSAGKGTTSDYFSLRDQLSRQEEREYNEFKADKEGWTPRTMAPMAPMQEPPVQSPPPPREYYSPRRKEDPRGREVRAPAPAPYQVAGLGFTPPPQNAQPPGAPLVAGASLLDQSPGFAGRALNERAAQTEAARRASDVAAQEFAAWNPADADRFAAQEAAREFGAMTQYGIDAPRTAATPSGAYTASELDAITRAEEAQAKAEESKSFMERLGFTQPTAAEQRPAFHWLDPNAYFDPTGAGAFNIAQGRSGLINTDPLSLGLFAAAAAPGIPPAFGPLSTAFMGITEKMAEARAVDRTREMYGLPTTKSYQRDYQPSWAYTAPPSWVSDLMNKANLTDLEKEQVEGYLGKAGSLASGIGSFFGFGGQPLFDEEELYDLDFAGHLGDVGAETLTYGDHSRAAPDYSGTTGYAPGERAYDRYTHHYTQALDEYNRNMTQAMQMPESPEKADLISYYSRLHPNLREREFDEKAFQDSAWERGEWDFTLDPVTYPSGESTVGWTDPEDLNDPNKGLVDPVTGLMYTAALDRMNPDFDKLLDVNERIDAARLSGIAEREEEEDKTEREALEQMEESRGGSSIPSDPGYSDEVASWGESIGGGW